MTNRLRILHEQMDACRACPDMIGPVVHGPAIASRVYAIGQAPGAHEGRFGKPFAWTAGKTMFGWFRDALGVDEQTYRERVYMAAVARCFPGKDPKGGDRKPDEKEIASCRRFIETEIALLSPELVLPIGMLAIEQVLGEEPGRRLVDVVGKVLRARYHGADVDVICLPHPSGASTWHRVEPGKRLLKKALKLLGAHPAWQATFSDLRAAG